MTSFVHVSCLLPLFSSLHIILINHTISCFDSWMRKHDKNFTLQTIVAENNFRSNAIDAATILCCILQIVFFLPYPISTSYHIDKFFFLILKFPSDFHHVSSSYLCLLCYCVSSMEHSFDSFFCCWCFLVYKSTKNT